MQAAISHTASRQSLTPSHCPIHLKTGQHMHLRRAAGWTIRALGGTVWITQDGDIRDIVLQAGESFVVDRQGPVLLSSASPATEAELRLEHASLRSAGPCRAAKKGPAGAFAGPLRYA